MRKDRRSKARRERIIMLSASVFVLAALTVTGMYMKGKNEESKDDGYMIDFSAMEKQTQEKAKELDKAKQLAGQEREAQTKKVDELLKRIEQKKTGAEKQQMAKAQQQVQDNDLDYLSTGEETLLPEDFLGEQTARQEENPDSASVNSGDVELGEELHFNEEDGLKRPLKGEVLIPFSMDKSVYFETLDQYKYNPAMMIGAEVGTQVTACSDGKVIWIFEDHEIGKAVTLDLGDGYLMTYGQLREISVSQDSYVKAGDPIGFLAEPTKYYAREGSNLYLKMTKEDKPVNPEPLFGEN